MVSLDESLHEEKSSILLVDDNPTNLQLLMETLEPLGQKLLVAKAGPLALKIAKKASPSLVLLDILMPDMDGFEVCKQLKEDPATRMASVIFLSALDDVSDKVKGLELGAVDFITKPFQAEEVRTRVKTQLMLQALQRDVARRNIELQRELQVAQELLLDASRRVEGPLLGESPAIQLLRQNIERCAQTELGVLMTGPPGAGYETFARYLHQLSKRHMRTFFHINGASLDSTQVSLFPGSSSNGDASTSSKFELAHGGTIFFERINELDLDTQGQLLSFLQRQQTLLRSGAPVVPDVRIICASWQDLHQSAREGRFLLDLIPLLSSHRLHVPSLSERKEDIPALAKFFLQEYADTLGKLVEGISASSLDVLQSYSWPGNITELKSLIERQAALARSPLLEIDASQLEAGVTMGGYRLIERLGRGGMGEVWRARHQLLARPAAVKLIRTDNAKDAEKKETMFKRFQREARVTSHLQSPHTVELYDFGVDPSGTFYYVMEHLSGMDLLHLVQRFGPLSPARLVFLLKGICRSLEEAHSQGLIHRDIKPANIFICKLGPDFDFVKVLDFGIVKDQILSESETQLTQAVGGGIIGTPGFIAPEALQPHGGIDHRFDLYSLGCVAYWALTGQDVFKANHPMQVLFAHTTEIPVAPSVLLQTDLPQGLDQILLDCLHKDPEARPATARVLWQRLCQLEFAQPWGPEVAEQWWLTNHPEIARSVV